MAIQTVYYRQKIAGTGWRYRPLTVGRRPEAARNGPYFIRVRDSAGKYQWVKHDTEQAAAKAAKTAPVARQAQELGLTVDELTNEANTNRISIKTAVSGAHDLSPLMRTHSSNCWRICPEASGSSISWQHRGL